MGVETSSGVSPGRGEVILRLHGGGEDVSHLGAWHILRENGSSGGPLGAVG